MFHHIRIADRPQPGRGRASLGGIALALAAAASLATAAGPDAMRAEEAGAHIRLAADAAPAPSPCAVNGALLAVCTSGTAPDRNLPVLRLGSR